MRIALYVENNYKQIVMTPENEFEMTLLKDIDKQQYELSIKRGGFYHCQGGWVREWEIHHFDSDKDSTMFILREKKIPTNP